MPLFKLIEINIIAQHLFSNDCVFDLPYTKTAYLPIETNRKGMDCVGPPWLFTKGICAVSFLSALNPVSGIPKLRVFKSVLDVYMYMILNWDVCDEMQALIVYY